MEMQYIASNVIYNKNIDIDLLIEIISVINFNFNIYIPHYIMYYMSFLCVYIDVHSNSINIYH